MKLLITSIIIISYNDSNFFLELQTYQNCLRKLLFTDRDEQGAKGRLSAQLSGAMWTGTSLAPFCLYLLFHLPDAQTRMTSQILN